MNNHNHIKSTLYNRYLEKSLTIKTTIKFILINHFHFYQGRYFTIILESNLKFMIFGNK